jgi:hypothetical protein
MSVIVVNLVPLLLNIMRLISLFMEVILVKSNNTINSYR